MYCIHIANIVQMKIIYSFKKMHTGSLIILLVRKCLCVSTSRGEPSIYFCKILDTSSTLSTLSTFSTSSSTLYIYVKIS